MNKSNYLLLTAFFALLFTQVNAQQFFFSKVKPASCNATDGIITLVPTRGVPPFTYQWNTGSTEISLKNIPKGNYTVTLTDATGATMVHTGILNSEALDLYLLYSRPAGVCTNNSGALTVDPVGGTAPYTYVWSNGMTDAAIQGLTTGTYTVTVLDANGCSAEGEYEVAAFFGLYFPTAMVNTDDEPDCINTSNGALSANLAYSNFPPYSYAWSNGATDQTISNLTEGTYSVTISDALGCSASASTLLTKKMNTQGSVVCSGSTLGTASAELVNATTPVIYAWSNGLFGDNISNLTSGNYIVTATDALGCNSIRQVYVSIPQLYLSDYSQDCFSGANGYGYCNVSHDQGVTYLWDNGGTDFWDYHLTAGNHTITVTTALGCTLTGNLTIAQPIAPPFTLTTAPTDANCSINQGGALNLSISGGISPYNLYVSGPNGFLSSDINSLQNLQRGDYYISVSTPNFSCHSNITAHITDASGFEPALVFNPLDCVTGVGSAAIVNVNVPNPQYEWSVGSTDAAIFNLTPGCYTVSVTDGGLCGDHFSFCEYLEDTLQNSLCIGVANGRLLNDLGVAGCNGSQGIPFQLIRTMPSGALNFTDENGNYSVNLPTGTFDLDALQYAPGEIACPATGVQNVISVAGQTFSGLDFHYLNNNPMDLRVQQKPLRTAQPGYPFSMRLEVCNDGAAAVPGTLDFEYGNLLGNVTGHQFARHPGAFVLNSDNPGVLNNTANYSFPNIAPGSCELLQLDLLTQTNTPVNTEFITEARMPSAGDPTPANNISSLYNTVAGSFDPNSVLAYPARNGNPKDGGEIIRQQDNTIVYQIFFQNTGNAPADLVIVHDSLDENLDLSTIRNISASHDMKVSTQLDNKVLVFRFENINLPDSTADYAGSIGSIQYQIDLKPGISVGEEVKKQAAIFFDFNSPVLTNENVLEVVNSSKVTQVTSDKFIQLFPNPTDEFVGFYCDSLSKMSLFNALGDLLETRPYEAGLQQLNTTDLPNGIYLIRLETNGKIRSGKLVVSH